MEKSLLPTSNAPPAMPDKPHLVRQRVWRLFSNNDSFFQIAAFGTYEDKEGHITTIDFMDEISKLQDT